MFSGVPEDPEGDTVMAKHGGNVSYCAVKSLMHAIWTEVKDDQKDMAHWMLQIANLWTISRLSE